MKPQREILPGSPGYPCPNSQGGHHAGDGCSWRLFEELNNIPVARVCNACVGEAQKRFGETWPPFRVTAD